MTEPKVAKIELNSTQKNLVYNSVHMLRRTLHDAVGLNSVKINF